METAVGPGFSRACPRQPQQQRATAMSPRTHSKHRAQPDTARHEPRTHSKPATAAHETSTRRAPTEKTSNYTHAGLAPWCVSWLLGGHVRVATLRHHLGTATLG